MEFFVRAPGKPGRLAVFPGTFNPPTRAHLALARAALRSNDEVLFVLPRAFPHKDYTGADFARRAAMLVAAISGEPRFSAAASEGGLFIEIVRECRREYGPGTQIAVLCGHDAAERIVNWDYGEPGAFRSMLDEFELLVAPRNGAYEPPPEMRGRIRALQLEAEYDHVSATVVRERIARGEPWEHLVPETVVPLAREAYRPR